MGVERISNCAFESYGVVLVSPGALCGEVLSQDSAQSNLDENVSSYMSLVGLRIRCKQKGPLCPQFVIL